MKMRAICFTIVYLGVILVEGLPTRDALMVSIDGKDTAIVESTVREVRAAVPDKIQDLVNEDTIKAFLHHFQDSDGDDNERGYHKTMADEGAKGYKHFDSYHKKDGDKYGFETHSAFGKSDGAKADAGGQSGKYKEADEASHGDKENYETEDGAVDEGKEDDGASKSAYKVIEDVDEDGDSEQYQEGEDEGGKSAAHENQQAEEKEEDDKEDSGHYTEEEGDDNAAHYTLEDFGFGPKGNLDHYTDISGYAFGSDDGAEEDDEEAKSEHYEAAEEDEDY